MCTLEAFLLMDVLVNLETEGGGDDDRNDDENGEGGGRRDKRPRRRRRHRRRRRIPMAIVPPTSFRLRGRPGVVPATSIGWRRIGTVATRRASR